MKRILVPVDLYASNYASYKYALHLAESLDANVTLLFVRNYDLTC